MDNYVAIYQFIQKHCPYPNHYCNGKHVPMMELRKGIWVDLSRTVNRDKTCENFVSGTCQHPCKGNKRRLTHVHKERTNM